MRPLESQDLSAFSKWFQTTFSLKDDNGDLLKPTNRKFRASGSYRYLMLTGSNIDTSILLGNTPQVLSRHYSSGNEGENNNQLLATALTLENSVKCSDINSAKEQTKKELNIEILPYEEFIGKYNKICSLSAFKSIHNEIKEGSRVFVLSIYNNGKYYDEVLNFALNSPFLEITI